MSNVIFYKIDLFSALSNQSWTVYHKINDFVDLNFVFNKFFMNPPRTFNLVQQNMFDKNIQLKNFSACLLFSYYNPLLRKSYIY